MSPVRPAQSQVTDYPGQLPTLPMSRETATTYYREIVSDELSCRVRGGRLRTFLERLSAIELLLSHFSTELGAATIPDWDRKSSFLPRQVALSQTQQEFVDYCLLKTKVDDANELDASNRMVHLSGDPGSG